jgi:hypothetical protein
MKTEQTGPEFIANMRRILDNLEKKFLPEDIDDLTDFGYWLEALDIEIEQEFAKNG